MYVSRVELRDFRNYSAAVVDLEPGVNLLVGRNGQGKTNMVEALGYVATLASHRVASDAPLIRAEQALAIVRAHVHQQGRTSLVELEVASGRANRARLNRSSLSRSRDVLGTLRTVLFAPEDLALVKGDPGDRRSFLDALLVSRQPRWAGVIGDYATVVKQRTAVLKGLQKARRSGGRGANRRGPTSSSTLLSTESDSLSTGTSSSEMPEIGSGWHDSLQTWSEHAAAIGSQLLYARLRLVRDLGPHLAQAYTSVSDAQGEALIQYRASLGPPWAERIAAGVVPEPDELRDALATTMRDRESEEIDRGQCLVGPHRDELVITLGALPAKGYASHGETWSLALGLKLAAYHLLRHDLGEEPVLILDDVFAELDVGRRERLASLIADCEQVLITAAVEADIPERLLGCVFDVSAGAIARRDAVEDIPQDVIAPSRLGVAGHPPSTEEPPEGFAELSALRLDPRPDVANVGARLDAPAAEGK